MMSECQIKYWFNNDNNIFFDNKRLSNLINDLYSKDIQMRNLLLIAIQAGIPIKLVELREMHQSEIQMQIHIIANSFTRYLPVPIPLELAYRVVACYAYALGYNINNNGKIESYNGVIVETIFDNNNSTVTAVQKNVINTRKLKHNRIKLKLIILFSGIAAVCITIILVYNKLGMDIFTIPTSNNEEFIITEIPTPEPNIPTYEPTLSILNKAAPIENLSDEDRPTPVPVIPNNNKSAPIPDITDDDRPSGD